MATDNSPEERMDKLGRKLDEITTDLRSLRDSTREFRGRLDGAISVLRWVRGLLAVTAICVVVQSFWVANSFGRMEAALGASGEDVGALSQRRDKLADAVEKQQRDIAQIRTDIAEMKAQFRADIAEIKSLIKPE